MGGSFAYSVASTYDLAAPASAPAACLPNRAHLSGPYGLYCHSLRPLKTSTAGLPTTVLVFVPVTTTSIHSEKAIGL